jgi:FAD/FMN-containing dehydrogenase
VTRQPWLTRREFLKQSAGAIASTTVLGGSACTAGSQSSTKSGSSPTAATTTANLGVARCKPGIQWTNYPVTQWLTPFSTCTPQSLADVIATVREAEAAGKRVHAFGSGWSFSDCARTGDYLIDTRQLNQELPTIREALRPDRSDSLLYHVEAGITIRALYERLDGLDLALETMGGASGQTLAGALSTGTHGGDKFMPPLADSVLAIHLVGAGGTQFWIEPSSGITNSAKLREHVVPGIDRLNIIYDDETFDACLVSLGAMGIVYAVVLKVRKPYDLVETTVATTWQDFKESASARLNDPENRFLQVLVNPYSDTNSDNLCLVTTRSEADETGPAERLGGDREAAVEKMVRSMTFGAAHKVSGVIDRSLPEEDQIARIVQLVLTETDQRHVMVEHYGNILRAGPFQTGTFRGSSFSVMDIGWADPTRNSQPGYSLELHFPASVSNGELGFVDFIDALIATVNARVNTFFTGYLSLRFTGRTRASLGMQQWSPTCAVEISVVQGVSGLFELLTDLYKIGLELGGLPHWGQLLDLCLQGDGSLYPRSSEWRNVYAQMSNGYAAQTFENWLTRRWKLTTPSAEDTPSETDQRTVAVPEASSLVPLGAAINAGDHVKMQPDPNAEIWSGILLQGRTGPAGYDWADRDPKFPLKRIPYRPYSLIYKFVPISNQENEMPWQYLGAETRCFVAPEPGRLLFRTNDDRPGNGDGAFRVTVTIEGR